MRKVLLFCIIGLIVAGGICFYIFQPLKTPVEQAVVPLESVLPSDTVGLMKLYDFTGQLERFKAERLGQSLAKMDFPAILSLMRLSPEAADKVLAVKEKVRKAINSTWFDTLFGREVAFVLQPVSTEIKPGEEFDEEQIVDTFIFVSRPKKPARVLESLNSMFNRQLNIQTQDYKQWKIKQFVLEGDEPVYYALTNELLIAAFSPDVVRQCLDQSLDVSSSLLENESYKKHCADLFRAGQTDMIFFADCQYIMDFIENAQKTITPREVSDLEMQAFRDQLAMMNGLEKISIVSYDDGGPLEQTKIIASFDRDTLSPILEKNLGIQPQKNPTLQYAPAGAILYGWQNYFDLPFYWKEFMKGLAPGKEDIEKVNRYFSQDIGVELEQFLSAFGSQLVFLINDINTGGRFPFPELGIILEVKNPDVVERTIQGLFRQTGMPLQKELHNGDYLSFIASPMGMDLSPAYLCRDDFCFLAINKRLLKSILDSPQNGDVSGQKNFKEVDKGISGENNEVSYINLEELNLKAREVLTWGTSWMAVTQPDKGERFKKVADLVIIPLLDGLSMYKAVGLRNYTEEERAVSEIYTLVDPS